MSASRRVALVSLLPHPHLTARVVTAGSWLCFRALASDAAYTGEETEAAAQAHGMRLMVVKRPEGSHGFVLLPKRWVVERSFAWVSRFRRLAHDYERLPATLAGLHFAAFVCLLLPKLLSLIGDSEHSPTPH